MKPSRLHALALTTLAAAALLPACESAQPAGGELPPEAGSRIRLWQERQIAKAENRYFVVFRHEWSLDRPALLNEFGQQHLRRLAEMSMIWDYPVVIEEDPTNADLNAQRVQTIVAYLNERQVPRAQERVAYGPAPEPQMLAEDLLKSSDKSN